VFEVESCVKPVVPDVADPVPGICDEISFPLAKRVAKLSSPEPGVSVSLSEPFERKNLSSHNSSSKLVALNLAYNSDDKVKLGMNISRNFIARDECI